MDLQTMFKPPRAGQDPRVAKTDQSRLSIGENGLLYKKVDEKDYAKYHTMSDEDTIEEFVRSQRMKESVLAMTGRLSKTRSDGPKFVAPQLGTASRSRKVEARTFNQALSGNDERGSSGKSEVIRQLQENTRRNQGYTEPVANSTRTIRTSIGGLGVTQGSDDRIETVVNLLKEKYEQNLLVVDKLFHEKKQMANKIKMLEEKLNTVSQNGSRINSQDEGDDYYGDVPQRDHLGPPQYEDFEPVMNQTSRPRCTSANGTRNSHAYSAADFASELAESRSTARSGEERGRAKVMRSHSAPRNMRRSGSAQTSTNKFSPRNSYAEPLSSSRRSISATRSVTGVSADLLADADKYIQRRRFAEEREAKLKRDQEQYEKEQQERFRRASKVGKEFTNLTRSHEVAKETNALRQQKKLEKEIEEQKKKEEERRAKKKINDEHAKSFKNQLSWKELQDLEEVKRRERMEKRKQELQLSSSLPKSLMDSLNRPKRLIPTEEMHEFRAPEPEKVKAKLEAQKRSWDDKLRRSKQENEEIRNMNKIKGIELHTHKLEERDKQFREKMENKRKQQAEKEMMELKKQKEEERKRRDKVLKTSPDDVAFRLTKSMEARGNKNKEELMKLEQEQKRLNDKLRRKEQSLKEAGVVVRTIMSERDHELGRGRHSTMELNKSDTYGKEAAIAAREAYRTALREAKLRIKDSLQKRPSLMQRHDMDLAAKKAATDALGKVANAVRSKENEDSKNDNNDDDIFDAKERLILGI